MPPGEPPDPGNDNDGHWWKEIKTFLKNVQSALRGASCSQALRELLSGASPRNRSDPDIERRLAEAAARMGEEAPTVPATPVTLQMHHAMVLPDLPAGPMADAARFHLSELRADVTAALAQVRGAAPNGRTTSGVDALRAALVGLVFQIEHDAEHHAPEALAALRALLPLRRLGPACCCRAAAGRRGAGGRPGRAPGTCRWGRIFPRKGDGAARRRGRAGGHRAGRGGRSSAARGGSWHALVRRGLFPRRRGARCRGVRLRREADPARAAAEDAEAERDTPQRTLYRATRGG